MTTRHSTKPFASPRTVARAVGGTLAAAATVFAMSVAAAPQRAAAAPKSSADAGASASAPASNSVTAAVAASSADAGAPQTTTAAGDAGAITGPESIVGTTSSAVPTYRRTAPPLPRPSPGQVAAYQAMKEEADVYERGAGDYKQTITDIITLHYKEKERSILSGLDREIKVESDELEKARDNAIARLKAFVDKYANDPLRDPQATPDAMYRLAALYEEKAKKDTEDPDFLLKSTYMNDAIALYKRIIREYPKYREVAGVHYFLGHAYKAQNKKNEAQFVWRSLVCANHYTYPNPKDAPGSTQETILPLPQDHDENYWTEWRKKIFTWDDLKHASKGTPDIKYVEVYPQDCTAIPQPALQQGEEQKFVAEVWLNIGNWEFDNDDLGGGVSPYAAYAAFDFNRAASAYQNSMRVAGPKSIVYGVSLYKYAWTLFKEQRFHAATKAFVDLLRYSDELEKAGQPVADFRSEAYTYIAGALTNVDFEGPAGDDPYVEHEDIIQKDPAKAVSELKIAFTRAQDPNIVPQDMPWTIEIYKALAAEYRAIPQYGNAIMVYREILKRWPMDPTAPDVQNAIADTYDLWSRTQLVGSKEKADQEAEVLKARTALANYVNDKPDPCPQYWDDPKTGRCRSWMDENKDNPGALANAEKLVRSGLQAAANRHTYLAQQDLAEAERQASNQNRDATLQALRAARDEFRLAALGWKGYLAQDANAPDAYETRFLLAYCLKSLVSIQVNLHALDTKTEPEPTPGDIEAAKNMAIAVRDSDEDDKHLDDAATYVVGLSDVARDLAIQRYQATNGASGIEDRFGKDPDVSGPSGQEKVVQKPIPAEIASSMQARDDYIQRVPPDKNPTRILDYLSYAGESYYDYGHFQEARERFEPIYRENCGKNEYGYKAWARLIGMSNLENDAERSRQLAEAAKAKSCAINDNERADEARVVNPTLMRASFAKAWAKFQEAQAAEQAGKPAKDVQALWAESAQLYESALKATKEAAASDDAPKAAFNSGYAYRKSGNTAKALEMYRLFIDNYGKEDTLNALEKDHNAGKLKREMTDTADGKQKEMDAYEKRVDYLLQAYEAFSATYYSFFDYRRAADSYAKVANNRRFPADHRQTAAKNAMVIYGNIGDRANMNAEYNVLVDKAFNLPADKRAEVDFRRADFDYSQWDPNSPDTGSNGAARRTAYLSLNDYYTKNKGNGVAARYALEAVYKLAKMSKAVNDPAYRNWYRDVITAWEYFNQHPQEITGADGKKTYVKADDFVDWPAEADFTLLDEEIAASFDYSDKKDARYNGSILEVPSQLAGDWDKVCKGEYTPGPAAKTLKEAAANAKAQQANPNSAVQDHPCDYKTMLGYRPRLETIQAKYKSKNWAPAISARVGSLYDTLRRRLDGTAMNMPKEIEKIIQQLEANNQFQDADDFRDQVRVLWNNFKLTRLEILTGFMVKGYAPGAILARALNVKSPVVDNAVARLAFYTDYLNEDQTGQPMRKFVEKAADPTSSATCNPGQNISDGCIKYTPRMFVQWRAGRVSHPNANGAGAPLPVSP